MEVKNYDPFSNKPRLKPRLLPRAKPKPKSRGKLEAMGLNLENKKNLDFIYAMGFVGTTRK